MKKEFEKINNLVCEYYRKYYGKTLKLAETEELVKKRLLEDSGSFCSRFILNLESFLGTLSGKKILIVGAGTGGEMAFLKSKDNEVYCIEPDSDAVKILHYKAQKYKIPAENIIQGVGEDIPFESDYFEIVYCSSVLEHVKSVKRVIDEMIRVTVPKGKICISVPNYLYPCERHYKIPVYPPALPFGKQLLKLSLKKRILPTGFINTLNFITNREIMKYLKSRILKQKIVCCSINPVDSSKNYFIRLYCVIFGITLHQEIIISKLKGNDA